VPPGGCPTTQPRGQRFSDVPSDNIFYEDIMDLNDRGVVGGYADGTYRPNNFATRGQLVKIAVLGFGFPLQNPPNPSFTDVPPNHTFYQHIETAVAHGLIGGYADGTFRPDNNVTRGQIAKIVMQAAGYPLKNPATPTFSDTPPGHTFYQHVETASAHGVIGGYADGTFRPDTSATRGQIAKMVNVATYMTAASRD
jgi:ribosomal protein L30/L7E